MWSTQLSRRTAAYVVPVHGDAKLVEPRDDGSDALLAEHRQLPQGVAKRLRRTVGEVPEQVH